MVMCSAKFSQIGTVNELNLLHSQLTAFLFFFLSTAWIWKHSPQFREPPALSDLLLHSQIDLKPHRKNVFQACLFVCAVVSHYKASVNCGVNVPDGAWRSWWQMYDPAAKPPYLFFICALTFILFCRAWITAGRGEPFTDIRVSKWIFSNRPQFVWTQSIFAPHQSIFTAWQQRWRLKSLFSRAEFFSLARLTKCIKWKHGDRGFLC